MFSPCALGTGNLAPILLSKAWVAMGPWADDVETLSSSSMVGVYCCCARGVGDGAIVVVWLNRGSLPPT